MTLEIDWECLQVLAINNTSFGPGISLIKPIYFYQIADSLDSLILVRTQVYPLCQLGIGGTWPSLQGQSQGSLPLTPEWRWTYKQWSGVIPPPESSRFDQVVSGHGPHETHVDFMDFMWCQHHRPPDGMVDCQQHYNNLCAARLNYSSLCKMPLRFKDSELKLQCGLSHTVTAICRSHSTLALSWQNVLGAWKFGWILVMDYHAGGQAGWLLCCWYTGQMYNLRMRNVAMCRLSS